MLGLDFFLFLCYCQSRFFHNTRRTTMSILIIGVNSAITDAIACALVEQGLAPVTVVTTLSEFEEEIKNAPNAVAICGQVAGSSAVHLVKSMRKKGKWGENVPVFVLYLPESLKDGDVDEIATAIGVLGDVVSLDLDIRKPTERIAAICRICLEMLPRR